MIFDFNQRVRVIACERTIADGTADCTGYIAGKSQEDDSTDVISCLAILV